jgi:Fe-S-cluster containining protein
VDRVFSLSIHADYRCRHSGACCTADWDVPVELPIYRTLSDAVGRRQLRVSPAAGALEPFIVGPDLPDAAGAMLERTDAGHCVFFDAGARLCIVHRDLGEPALPETCRHFPRLSVQDARGTFVSLSHFCPTAASMLFREDVEVTIVERPAAFPHADYDGLIVTGEDLPPLLHPRMLMDMDGYEAWEAHMVGRCAEVRRRPESVLATLARDARLLARWRPAVDGPDGAAGLQAGRSLREAVAALPREYVAASAADSLTPSLRRHAEVMRAVPEDLRPARDEAGLERAFEEHVRPRWDGFRAPLNRYLAAKAFASWTAYQGRGVRSIVRGLEAALALVRVEAARLCRDGARDLDRDLLIEAVRAADFALNHLAVGEELAQAWSAAESLHHAGV